ncbi:hypothetical protein A1O1_06731 [Capronia coronata CBS 617.96]|uniref:Uncharacterized protein n=1 Tax=Capronia coronata CBS 617.96 TaxID=1182541 RepID=W9XRC4_9EURO|nr:uncharacterized protein A1O1_06731 [Capronia coronata CBS 617.96]EXJ83112.1 hypothetical protein A1O1_06731 [Capronia coronata CBS 617.96]
MPRCLSHQCRYEQCQPSSSRRPDPLTAGHLTRIGKQLIRWKLLTFYGFFFEPDEAASVRASINTCTLAIRAELKRVDVVKTWQQYEDERARGRFCYHGDGVEMELYKAGAFKRLKDNLLRRTKVQVVRPRDHITRQGEDSPAICAKHANGRLRDVFRDAARDLGVPCMQFEAAVQMYAQHIQNTEAAKHDEGRCSGLKSRQKPKQNMGNAESIARDGNWGLLARILLADIEDLAPSSREGLMRTIVGRRVPSTPDRLPSSEARSPTRLDGPLATAPARTSGPSFVTSAFAKAGEVFNASSTSFTNNGPALLPSRSSSETSSLSSSCSSSSTTPRVASCLLVIEGPELRDILSAIWACKEKYFIQLKFDGPRRNACPCGVNEYCRTCGPFSVKAEPRASTPCRRVWARLGSSATSSGSTTPPPPSVKGKEKERDRDEEEERAGRHRHSPEGSRSRKHVDDLEQGDVERRIKFTLRTGRSNRRKRRQWPSVDGERT